MKTLLLVIFLAAVTVVGVLYYQHNKSEAKSEDPKVEKVVKSRIEEKITGSGKVDVRGGLYYVVSETDGKIAKVAQDLAAGRRVKKDEVLIHLDDTLPQFRLREAESALATAQASVVGANAKKKQNQAQVEAIKKELEFQRARLDTAERTGERGSLAPGQLAEARKEYEKYVAAADAANALVSVADADITTAVANASRAEAALNLAKQGLEQMKIKAPSEGVVLNVNKVVRDGQLITRGLQPNQQPLLIIAENLNDWEVNAQISEQDIGRLQNRLRMGSAVPTRFSVEAYTIDKIRFTGQVTTIAELPTAPQRSGFPGLEALQMGGLGGGGSSGPSSYTVTIHVDPIRDEAMRKNHPLKVGFVATDLQIIVEEFNDVVCVPALALSFKPDGLSEARLAEITKYEDEGWTAIWFYNNGKYTEKYIKAGASAEQLTHVREVMNGKPEDLLNQSVVVEGPKRTDKNGGLFGEGKTFKIPG